jgi:pyridinium-3,5-bisthiocarboxylic acid mononucleotide nickel chelatase
MKILYYDCFSGISGDMNLGAMLDLGVDIVYLKKELSKLNLDQFFEFEVLKSSKNEIFGEKVNIKLTKEDKTHRHLKDIKNIINKSELSEKTKKISLKIFENLAESEAKVHGTTKDKIHFHETGSIDAIIDIVGGVICFEKLNVDEVWCSEIELGGGFVNCAHGRIPVPAPATVELLKNIPTKMGAVDKETTTPTGAAILSVLVDKFIKKPSFIIKQTGYGIGERDLEIPNVLRVFIGETENSENCLLLQCNIDDMTGESLGFLMEILFKKGAMDVDFTPIIMKKNRPATKINVLCSIHKEDYFKNLLFKHATTNGIKSILLTKTALKTDFEKINTKYGEIIIKNTWFEDKIIRSKPELENCREAALKYNVSLNEIYSEIGKLK